MKMKMKMKVGTKLKMKLKIIMQLLLQVLVFSMFVLLQNYIDIFSVLNFVLLVLLFTDRVNNTFKQ